MEAETPDPKSLKILSLVKEAQLKNGMRHKDYMCYRRYCSRRLRRVRKATKLSYPRNKFKQKVLEPKHITRAECLSIPLLNAERSWSHAMQLKDEIEGSSRRRYHLLRRLTKAASYSNELQTLCQATADSQTQLEAEAYNSWMHGNVYLEQDKHEDALQKFVHAKTLLLQLGNISDASTEALCKERVEQIDLSVKYCKYMTKRSSNVDDATMMEQVMANDMLKDKLETIMADTRHKKAEALDHIDWEGGKIAVSNERIRYNTVRAQELTKQLDNSTAKALFAQIFACYEEIMVTARDEIRDLGLKKMTAAVRREQEEHLKQIQLYASIRKSELQVRRDLVLAQGIRNRIKQQEEKAVPGRQADLGKRSRPSDLVSLYEKLMQNVTDMVARKKVEDESYKAQLGTFKALRCFYLACAYQQEHQFSEAYLLYHRAGVLIKTALSLHRSSSPVEEAVRDLEELYKSAEAKRSIAHAMGLLADQETQRKVQIGIQDLVLTKNNKKDDRHRSLLDRLNRYDAGDPDSRSLVDFPPKPQAVPAKPILFDLAYQTLAFPDLSNKVKEDPKVDTTKAKGWGDWFMGR